MCVFLGLMYVCMIYIYARQHYIAHNLYTVTKKALVRKCLTKVSAYARCIFGVSMNIGE